MYLLYSAALAAAAALSFPYFLYQGIRYGKYLRSFRARWGNVELPETLQTAGAIWLHAVSVGEVLACPRLVEELRERMPDRKILVSTTTETGFAAAQKRLRADGFFYCPFDFAFAVRRVLKRIRPSLLIVAETELWPNLFREARESGAKVALVNARVSDRSFPRYKAFRFFFQRVLGDASLLMAQSAEDARRLTEMGGEHPQVASPLKYDQPSPAQLPSWLVEELTRWAKDGLLVAGSTAAGEEEHILRAWKGRLIIAPRRPERFDVVEKMARMQRRSGLVEGVPITSDILLLDTVGELAAIYQFASVVFVGGSLVDHGGQNPLEPAWFAKPIVVGPSMTNFRDITEALRSAGALSQVRSPDELAAAFTVAAGNREMGARARAVLDANSGGARATAAAIAALLEAPAATSGGPAPTRQAPGRPVTRGGPAAPGRPVTRGSAA